MAARTLYAAETWDKVYQAFDKINFVSFDYESVKESLIQYMKLYYAEVFNDYIETSEMIVIIDAFAVVAEQLAYRIDMASHENFMSTAERKQNILKLAKLISYNSSRNLPARGLVKLTSISTSESIIDSQGNDLANRTIVWNDSNNALWKEQFFLVVNRMMSRPYGQPSKSYQVGDIAFQLYTFNNAGSAFTNGVFAYSVATNTETVPMEIVSADLDSDGVFEKAPDNNSLMQLVYAADGLGDGSDLTGFLMYTKQGSMTKIPLSFANPIPNQVVDINLQNINNADVWINKVNTSGATLERWEKVDTINAQNIYFNVDKNRSKFEVETLENDKIRLLFGDGNFANIPVGDFNVWVRQSLNSNVVIQKNRVINKPMGFTYLSAFDITESTSLTFSLVSTLQNSSASEDIEHIRRTAPSTYYSQGRMVNGQDYNTLLLRDPSILKLKSVNRTFAGQPKYIDWNDASGAYQNVKVFGDDLRTYLDFKLNSTITTVSSRILIDQVLEPMLKTSNIMNVLSYASAQNIQLRDVAITPRHTFIETRMQLEKTEIQGKLDRHYYGEHTETVVVDGVTYAVAINDDDGLIYTENMLRQYRDENGNVILSVEPSKLQPRSEQPTFGIGYTTSTGHNKGGIRSLVAKAGAPTETWTIEFVNDGTSANVFSVTGSVSGLVGFAVYNEAYSNDYISFIIDSDSEAPYVLGDAFVLDVVGTAITKRAFIFSGLAYTGVNLIGRWVTIDGDALDRESPFDPAFSGLYATQNRSWVFIIDRLTNSEGVTTGWQITYRDFKITVESPTTKFWHNSDTYITDPNSKNRVRDRVALLKSNLNRSKTLALGSNKDFDVIDSIKYNNGIVNHNALEVLPTDASGTFRSGDGVPDANMLFSQLVNVGMKYIHSQNTAATVWTITHNLNTTTPVIDFVGLLAGVQKTVVALSANQTRVTFTTPQLGRMSLRNISSVDYVYFKAASPDDVNSANKAITATADIKNLFVGDALVSTNGAYIRKIGRDSLDFLWQHFTPSTNLIDPSTSNIIDMFVLTRGYFDTVSSYITRQSSYVPVAPTPLELRNSYSDLLSTKMISDTVVMHSGKIKLLMGDLADQRLRAKFRVIKAQSSTLTDDQIKAEIVSVINTFFAIENWNFGDTFYATELFSLIHQRLPQDVASVVLVPLFVNNSFGSMFVIESGEDEILQSCATINDIELVNTYTATTLRQIV